MLKIQKKIHKFFYQIIGKQVARYDWMIDESAGNLVIMGVNAANQI